MQNFGRENFDDSTCIRQTFPPSSFTLYGSKQAIVDYGFSCRKEIPRNYDSIIILIS